MEIEIHCSVITELVFHLWQQEYDLPSWCQPLASIVFLPLATGVPPSPPQVVAVCRFWKISLCSDPGESTLGTNGANIWASLVVNFACPEIKLASQDRGWEEESWGVFTSLIVNNKWWAMWRCRQGRGQWRAGDWGKRWNLTTRWHPLLAVWYLHRAG